MSYEEFTDLVPCVADFKRYEQLSGLGRLPSRYVVRYVAHDDGIPREEAEGSDVTGGLDDSGLYKWRMYDLFSTRDENNCFLDRRMVRESKDMFLSYAECLTDWERFKSALRREGRARRRRTEMNVELFVPDI